MRTVITGGSGLIGRELAQSLASEGREVVVLSRSPGAVAGLPRGVRAEAWDGESVGPWAQLLAGAAVVLLAGDPLSKGRWTATKKRRILESRVRSSRAIAAAVAAAPEPPAVVVQGSAVGFYGDRGEEVLTEASSPGTGFLPEVCQQWEAATAELEARGVRRPRVRTGVVLSPRGGALPQIALPFRLFAGGPAGNGRQYLPWIHWQDEVAALRFLIDHPTATGPFNLTAPEPASSRDFARTLGQVLGRPSFVPAPAFALRLALGEKAALVLEGQRVMPQQLLELGFRFRFPELRAALEDLLG
ncbi:MAG: TIGR01777 family oxidoreductase [Thermoanaerobaculia bacterium]